jgi:hypothetical protein
MNCRVRLDATDIFTAGDTLRAFLRIYPGDKLEKRPPDAWKATFLLRSDAGAVALRKEIPFTIDSGSGFVAFIQMPLQPASPLSGRLTLEVLVQGPGIRGEIIRSRSIYRGSRPPDPDSAGSEPAEGIRID